MTSIDSTTNKRQRLFPADFAPFITAILEVLGDGWTLDDDQPTGLTAFLTHTDGRRIGIRHLWRGEAVQTWAIDVPRREFTDDNDAASYTDSLEHLTPGIRYNTGVAFTTNPPAKDTAATIRARLLPAFEGERPPLRAFPRKRARPAAKKTTTGTSTKTKATRTTKAAKPKPEPRGNPPAKATAAKTPSARSTKPQPTAKKTAAPAKPRRTTPTPTKTAKPRPAKAQQTKPTSTN
ncbi:hypothetical protein [Streptomyces sp. AK08-02]|uniref:hypothetical protein n=1 Tax=Streptomyces sp. AK08-02 TaxID=3028654 RepID=UPI0029AFB2E3|nr:hypothetical protein [Streptomyces sp. AK08-02]MDX3749653.1 hypothetical protein [Streptomyces sp. AK08-02]